jgi:replicative DNA helicase
MTNELTRAAERALVAGPLVRGASELALVRASVSAKHIDDGLARTVFEAECKVSDAGRDLTIIAVAGALESMGAVIGVEQLRLLAEADLPGEREDLATRVVNAALVRRTARRAAKLAELGETAEALENPDRYFASVSVVADEAREHVQRDWINSQQAVWTTMQKWTDRGRKQRVAAYPLGALNELLDGGTEPKRFVVIGARPSVGKSALETDAMYHMADIGHPQFTISLEMDETQIVARAACQRLGLDGKKWKRGPQAFTRPEYEAIIREMQHLSGLPVTLLTNHYELGAALAKARVWLDTVARPLLEADQGALNSDGTRTTRLVPVVRLDYFQLAHLAGKWDTRDQMLGAMAGMCKAFAANEDCAVHVIAAIGRANAKEKREPTMSDLRECGALEFAADTIILLHRDTNEVTEGPGRVVEQDATIIVDKNRDGETGRVQVTFKKPSARFVAKVFEPGQQQPEAYMPKSNRR